ncbi:hypothetical protein EYC80_002205 [Monilinia laxa]|uniref:Uncharacterized protein n=1 Tax=Monilinia laxa TaxID=61186 RepID=A0A5N6K334_MONLA|nr:hypothetical protein EYC80_002205 [Monilinia laxa]
MPRRSRSRSRSRSRPQNEQGDDDSHVELYRSPARLARMLASNMDTPESQQQPGSGSINRQMGQDLQQEAADNTRGRTVSREVTRGSIKQSTSPTPADYTVTVLSLQQAYPGDVAKQTQFLQLIRPFKGCGVDKLSDFDRRSK